MSKVSGPFVLRINENYTWGNPKFIGRYVKKSWSRGDQNTTEDLSKAWLFTTLSAAKNCADSGYCDIVPVDVTISLRD